MRRAIRWHPDAEAELTAEIDWYERQQAGLGDRFEVEVLDVVAQAAAAPDAWPPLPAWNEDTLVRSKGASGFPHSVVYFVEDDLLTVLAVAHSKRRPGYWRDRIYT